MLSLVFTANVFTKGIHPSLQNTRAMLLTLGIVTGCLIIGSAIVMTLPYGPRLFGMPVLGLFGFLLAFVNSIWVILSIWRSGKA